MEKNRKEMNLAGKLIVALKCIFWFLPIIFGVVGYGKMFLGSHSCLDSIYASAALYFVNPVFDDSNWAVLAAKYLALLVATTVIVTVLSRVSTLLRHFVVNRSRDSVAVDTDMPWPTSSWQAAVTRSFPAPRPRPCPWARWRR